MADDAKKQLSNLKTRVKYVRESREKYKLSIESYVSDCKALVRHLSVNQILIKKNRKYSFAD